MLNTMCCVHAHAYLPTVHLLQPVVSPNCSVFNHLRETEVTRWQLLNFHKEISSCHLA